MNHFGQCAESRGRANHPFLEFLDQDRAAIGHQELAQALARRVRLVTESHGGSLEDICSGAPENQAGATGTDQRNLGSAS